MPSPAPKMQQEVQEVPLKLVGGNKFGRYVKISIEETFNMIVSDNALVDYAGYANVLTQSPNSPGRGIYSSGPGVRIIAVWGSVVFSIVNNNNILTATAVGNLSTSVGDVFIAENNNKQIGITDGVNLYVYNWGSNAFTILSFDVDPVAFPIQTPGYISFQNGRLIIVDLDTTNWYLSAENDALTWLSIAQTVGSLQTKPDTVQAAVPVPGAGNNLILFGHNVMELWQDVGAALFPYQRASTFNVDYGCLNASSIAALDNYIVWLGANEQSGATLMVYSGSQAQSISTDGIDFKLNNLSNPTNCTGFLFRQDGHLLYQFTFPDDNLSYIYDFETKLFFTVTDEDFNYHIARNVVFFDNDYYFVSLKGGDLYIFGTQYTNFQYDFNDIRQIPRVRVCPPIRLPSQRMFIIKSIGFTIENGQPNDIQTFNTVVEGIGDIICTESVTQIATEGFVLISTEGSSTQENTYTLTSEAVDLSISRDGGETFGASWRLPMNPVGKRKSRFIWQRCGQANDVTLQFKFWGFGRFVVAQDGVCEVYQ